ncbi:MAG: hypothetical protein KJ970_03885 [Candidatus Eisenbacteria bacterium]|uniref:Uroporphyrinogen decarboxylase (URO-D) domain-containing protein n=1 Tax=Eiseniibacteriota bacterium TaxID=2212470 RepID=A0A948RUY5_UNCEI|nr:hypothetical protein [Candidatus Eisenbacteria bacterium]MBU1951014.1 hypothetical protein [Candidatus Eisenbacteria bacterium]MBU2690043.1 hypothetical protein [Candidatus Eisenbacteria bacterium]
MNSRERILTALDGGEPDRVPRALSCFTVDFEDLVPANRRRDDLVDCRTIYFPASKEEEQLFRRAVPVSPDTRLGTPSQISTYTQWNYYPEDVAQRNPLAEAKTLDELKQFPFPNASGPHHAKGLMRQVDDLHARGLAAGGSLPHLGGELFEGAWRLRGLDNFLIDLVRRPDMAHYLLDRLMELALRNAEALAKAGIDLLTLDDDVGMPGTMIISPATWDEFFKPRLSKIIQAARCFHPSLRVLYHSDGYFEPILEGLIEIGVNAIHPLQPEHMDAGRIRGRFGSSLAFWGTVGRQTTFSFGTPDLIRREVRERIDTLGRAGLILCPAYDIDEPDIPWENIAAFLEAVHEHGRPQAPPGSTRVERE